jgi:hypothetical protein
MSSYLVLSDEQKAEYNAPFATGFILDSESHPHAEDSEESDSENSEDSDNSEGVDSMYQEQCNFVDQCQHILIPETQFVTRTPSPKKATPKAPRKQPTRQIFVRGTPSQQRTA